MFRSSPLLDALKYRHELCNDHQSSGFLLSNESDHEWSVACMWTGGETSASCALAPIDNKPINFIDGYKWRKMLYVRWYHTTLSVIVLQYAVIQQQFIRIFFSIFNTAFHIISQFEPSPKCAYYALFKYGTNIQNILKISTRPIWNSLYY